MVNGGGGGKSKIGGRLGIGIFKGGGGGRETFIGGGGGKSPLEEASWGGGGNNELESDVGISFWAVDILLCLYGDDTDFVSSAEGA